MRITKSQLKEIIKEALDDRINPDLDVFEWMTTDDGDILLSVEHRR